jgi:hypothetical protein
MTITQLLKITGTIACQYLMVSPELAHLSKMAQEILQIDSRKFVEITINRIFCLVFSKASLWEQVLVGENIALLPFDNYRYSVYHIGDF